MQVIICDTATLKTFCQLAAEAGRVYSVLAIYSLTF